MERLGGYIAAVPAAPQPLLSSVCNEGCTVLNLVDLVKL